MQGPGAVDGRIGGRFTEATLWHPYSAASPDACTGLDNNLSGGQTLHVSE
jgi:hypothetical protein